MVQRLLIDADPGVGDAIAIVLALLDPELDVVGLTASDSWLPGRQTIRNLQSIVEVVDPDKWPRLGCPSATRTASRNEVLERIALSQAELHGARGLADWEITEADLAHPLESAKLIIELSRMYPGELTILVLGPLTNLQLALELDPELPHRVGRVLCVAGAIDAAGDVSPVAELNAFLDPEALAAAIRAFHLMTVIPRDLSQRFVMTFGQVPKAPGIEGSRLAIFVHRLLSYGLRSHHQYLGQEGWPLAEVLGVIAAVRPQFFRRQSIGMDIETSGRLTRGMTIVDRRIRPEWNANVDLLRDVELQSALDYFHHRLKQVWDQ